MDAETLMTLNDATERLGTRYALVRGLITVRNIPHRRLGKSIVLDADGFAELERAVNEWRDRPRPYGAKAKSGASGASGAR